MIPYLRFESKSLAGACGKKEAEALNSFIGLIEKSALEHIFVLFSGGRDSLVVLHMAHRVGRALELSVEAVHVDTTVSTPGNIDYVESVCKKFNVKLSVVKPELDFFALVERWGFPTATRRWCCYHLKIEPLKRYFMQVLEQSRQGLIVDGIRAEESPRRRGFPKLGFHKHFRLPCYHPIFEWARRDVLNYIAWHSLPENPLYQKLPRATECWCTALKTTKQFVLLKQNWPKLFEKFVEAEARLKTRGSALFRSGKRVYLREL